uniref:Uncharacterized protein n=1 Tax=Chromera velia CCMP2878 TaxID=1169474 RepID=A0A0G4IED8_9ALVE|eukprot:Cvel_13715.t1-p1 / transcript=Cvel_13715.t1 / gene=Cvel_13715 / organism=Chromera_velia_CCMP2878 / gene_product=hypothetical protein / transcript_product=hypothetical protein / location=Cvel_scaffold948:24107-24829(-) / protein_length=241 / sequence_SO=supercontig / SO=protein_coding / is_pseudo=false
MDASRFYAVARGPAVGIMQLLESQGKIRMNSLMKGWARGHYKKFPTKEKAEEFMSKEKVEVTFNFRFKLRGKITSVKKEVAVTTTIERALKKMQIASELPGFSPGAPVVFHLSSPARCKPGYSKSRVEDETSLPADMQAGEIPGKAAVVNVTLEDPTKPAEPEQPQQKKGKKRKGAPEGSHAPGSDNPPEGPWLGPRKFPLTVRRPQFVPTAAASNTATGVQGGGGPQPGVGFSSSSSSSG